MTDSTDRSEHIWEIGWDGHKKAQLSRMSRLSFTEKIKWLKEAQEMIKGMKQRKKLSQVSD
jgi:hypothetical protein